MRHFVVLAFLVGLHVHHGSAAVSFPKAEQETAASLLSAEASAVERTKTARSFKSIPMVLAMLPASGEISYQRALHYTPAVLTHFAPAWFDVQLGEKGFRITSREVNLTWCRLARSRGARVLPRVWLADFTTEAYTRLLRTEGRENAITGLLNDLSEKVHGMPFDGLLIDFGPAPFNTVLARHGFQLLLQSAKRVATEAFGTTATVGITVPADRVIIGEGEVKWLQPLADFFIVTTFDRSPAYPGPIAPMSWIRGQLGDMPFARGTALVGLSLYGYKYLPTAKERINGTEALRLVEDLRRSGGELQWEATEAEHQFTYYVPGAGQVVVRFPTRASVLHRLKFASDLGHGVAIQGLGECLHQHLFQF